MLRWCPGCPPGFLPDGAFAWRDTPGGSEDGGFDELVEFWFNCTVSRATCASSTVIRSSAHASFASRSAMRATSAGSRWATPWVDHAAAHLSIPQRKRSQGWVISVSGRQTSTP